MQPPTPRIWLVTALSLIRPVAGLVFACLAFQHISTTAVVGIYLVAATSDLIDGSIARRLQATTFLGRVLDLIGDKSLTVVSLLYASARGIDLAPLALIAVREIAALGGRLLIVDGEPALRTSRLFGGSAATVMWGTTAFLIASRGNNEIPGWIPISYWACGAVLFANLALRVIVGRRRIMASAQAER